jgi:curved DNA-binding protein CbpA
VVNDPYSVLDLPGDADDDAIRRKYLELVRRFPPEQNPERFAEVRAAYEALKDINSRVRHRLFERGRKESIDTLIEEMACRSPRQRVSLETLLQTVLGRR